MPHCDRGLERDRPVLYWRHPHELRVPLVFHPAPGVACNTEARHSEVLVTFILCRQWERDANLILAHRGFVHVYDLAKRYSRLAGNPDPVSEKSIRQYIGRLHGRMDEATAEIGLDVRLRLIESKRGVGYRIASCGLYIEDTAWSHAIPC